MIYLIMLITILGCTTITEPTDTYIQKPVPCKYIVIFEPNNTLHLAFGVNMETVTINNNVIELVQRDYLKYSFNEKHEVTIRIESQTYELIFNDNWKVVYEEIDVY